MNELSKEQLMQTSYYRKYPVHIDNAPSKSRPVNTEKARVRQKIDDYLVEKELRELGATIEDLE